METAVFVHGHGGNIGGQMVNTALATCPECWTLLFLDRPSQAQRFCCPTCNSDLRVDGGYVVALAFGNSSRLHHLAGDDRQLRLPLAEEEAA